MVCTYRVLVADTKNPIRQYPDRQVFNDIFEEWYAGTLSPQNTRTC